MSETTKEHRDCLAKGFPFWNDLTPDEQDMLCRYCLLYTSATRPFPSPVRPSRRKGWTGAGSCSSSPCWISFTAVSYTHLDVYKRQALLSAKADQTAVAVHRVYDEYTALKFTHFGLCSQLFDALSLIHISLPWCSAPARCRRRLLWRCAPPDSAGDKCCAGAAVRP